MAEFVMEDVTGPETLDEIQRTLDTAWQTIAVSAATKMYVELAVSEIASNIIEHAGDGEPVHLRMAVVVEPDVVSVTFTDDGRPAPVELTTFDMPDAMAERGRGLSIAHRVLDELSYCRDQNGNHWTLVRWLSEEPDRNSLHRARRAAGLE
ncbi:anti-sigma regulatory factor [Mycobacterium sp. SWH-M1]|nr:anti-sigma regulatory factor [Mycobacterium sp. SWH-M1]